MGVFIHVGPGEPGTGGDFGAPLRIDSAVFACGEVLHSCEICYSNKNRC